MRTLKYDLNKVSLLYIDKTKRDQIYKELKNKNFNIRRTTHANQLIHPKYIEDYPYDIPKNQMGFGNTIYKTHFSKLYAIEDKIF